MFSYHDLLIGVAYIAIPVLTAAWYIVRMFIENRHLKRDVRDLETRAAKADEEANRLRRRAEDLEDDLAAAEQAASSAAEASRKLERIKEVNKRMFYQGNQLVEAYHRMVRQTAGAKEAVETEQKRSSEETAKRLETEREAENLRSKVDAFSEQIQQLERQVDEITSQDGQVWRRPVQPGAPAFRPATERGFSVISVLNFKGGVGKTTISAHLAAALGQRGKRVLLVDLDYQRSLSKMLVDEQQRKLLHLEGRCLQHFLQGDRHGARDFLRCVHDVGAGMPNCSIVTNSDDHQASRGQNGLEEVEARLMARWMVKPTLPDPRLLLREGLHCPELTRRFDHVILDCPPRLTTACVNALAASDCVLIPVVLDQLSAGALPELLKSLTALRSAVLPQLKILGVVANLAGIRSGGLVNQQHEVWEQLPLGLKNNWHEPIRLMKSWVPRNSAFARAADSLTNGGLRLALSEPDIAAVFNRMIAEIEEACSCHDGSNLAVAPA